MTQFVQWLSSFLAGPIPVPSPCVGYDERRREWDEHAKESIKE